MNFARYLQVGGFAVLLFGMLVMGTWLSGASEQRAIYHEGELFALYVDSVFSDRVESLADGELLSDADIIALDKLLYGTKLGKRIVEFTLWSSDGHVLYSTKLTSIGARFEPGPALAAAFRGETQSHMSARNDQERQIEGARGPALIETYAPVRDPRTQSILAVSQISQTTDVLAHAVGTARLQSWRVVIAVTVVMYLLLATLIRRASNTIVTQQKQLQEKVSQLTILLRQNEELHERVARAAGRATARNERFLHRIAVDLHDGAGQGIALAMMRLEQLAEVCSTCCSEIGSRGDTVAEQFRTLQQALNSSLQDMRSISTGLKLPDIEEMSMADIARRVVRNYERTSGVKVQLTIHCVPEDAPLPVKISLFRVLQESLANGFRHGGAVNQCVLLGTLDNKLQVEVRDEGKGFDPQAVDTEDHVGLEGMRERVEVLGGKFFIWSAAGQGTVVRADLPLTSSPTAHE
jgi:signal transduction histidine kinase